MTKQQLIDELARLYRLQDEGKNESKLIADLEEKLCELMGCEEESDSRTDCGDPGRAYGIG